MTLEWEEMYQFNCPDSNACWGTFGCHPEGTDKSFFTNAILTASPFSPITGFCKRENKQLAELNVTNETFAFFFVF